ncbi:MAG TPA: tetratricopeptide repeat protein [Bryobacteraceae bacterium]|nr:tetratricopeptide repeat protein [Bryobacteraceae bacterium]
MVSTSIVIFSLLFAPLFAQSNPPLTSEQRADILMARKMYREAADVYKEGPLDSAIILNKIGIAYHQMLRLDEAKKYYEKAIKANPKYSEAVNNLGTIYYSKKSFRKATSQYNKALKLNPNSASVYSNLGTAQFARKKYKEASESYQKALSLDPEVFEHRNSYGTLLLERSVAEKAKFHYYLAKTYASAGHVERAIQYIRMALEEGFKERNKLMEEPEFAKLRETAEFQALMALEPRVV